MTDSRTSRTEVWINDAVISTNKGYSHQSLAESQIAVAKELLNIRQCLDEIINQLRART